MSWINNLRMWIKLAAVFTAICVVIGASSLTTYRALSTIETTEKMTTHTYEVLEQLGEIVAGMVNSETGVRGYLVSGDMAFLAPLENGQRQYGAAVAKVGSLTSDNPAQQRRLETVKQNARAWMTDVAEREIALMKDPATRSKARELEASGIGKKTMDALRSTVQEMDREERALLSVRADAAKAAATYANTALAIGGATTLILSILGALSLTFAVTRPVQRMTREMTILAGGDTSVAISGVERRDEVGQMAQAIQVFKTNMLEVERLRTEQDEAETRAVAERKAEMQRIADGFEAAVGEIIETVSSASTELEAAAGTLTRTAESTQGLATRVASASEIASTNVQSVASATNEMASSVHEISRQVQESSRIAGDAVKQAEKTDSRINQLSQAASRIGDVVKLIT
ncbi:CHASE3 domain-containing protein, partial [Rhodoplanes sp. TEM]